MIDWKAWMSIALWLLLLLFLVLFLVTKHGRGVLKARCAELCKGFKGLFKSRVDNDKPVGLIEPILFILLVVGRICSLSAWTSEHSDQVTKCPKRKDFYILITTFLVLAVLLDWLDPLAPLAPYVNITDSLSNILIWVIPVYILAESLIASVASFFVHTYMEAGRRPVSSPRSLWISLILYSQTILVFAIIYMQPGLEFFHGHNIIRIHDPGDAIYLSAVTISTLGYGDYVPISPLGKMCTSIESVIGLLILALFVGYFVSYIKWRRDDFVMENGLNAAEEMFLIELYRQTNLTMEKLVYTEKYESLYDKFIKYLEERRSKPSKSEVWSILINCDKLGKLIHKE